MQRDSVPEATLLLVLPTGEAVLRIRKNKLNKYACNMLQVLCTIKGPKVSVHVFASFKGKSCKTEGLSGLQAM
jgi:hypothetical protein